MKKIRKGLDDIDIRIINFLQGGFPVALSPFRVISESLGISEEDVINRINLLKSKGIIRRIGAVFDSKRLGFHSTLIGVKADPSLLEDIAEGINKLPGITHHYQRDDEFNLWFTLTVKEEESIEEIIHMIKGWKGVVEVINLPSTRTFKIKVNFTIGETVK